MNKQVAMMTMAMLMGAAAVRADSSWSFEPGSPLWVCAVECSGASADDLGACLEACGRAHESGQSVMQRSADTLRCKATLMRIDAAQLACHSHCLSENGGPDADIVGCVDECDTRHDGKTARLLDSPRCASLQ